MPDAPGGPVLLNPLGAIPSVRIIPSPVGVGVRAGYRSGVSCPRGGNPLPRGAWPPVGNGARAAPGRGVPGPGGGPLPSPSCRPEGIAALFMYGFDRFRIFPVSGSRQQREEVQRHTKTFAK